MRARGKGSSPGRVEGSSRAMLATARPSCYSMKSVCSCFSKCFSVCMCVIGIVVMLLRVIQLGSLVVICVPKTNKDTMQGLCIVYHYCQNNTHSTAFFLLATTACCFIQYIYSSSATRWGWVASAEIVTLSAPSENLTELIESYLVFHRLAAESRQLT